MKNKGLILILAGIFVILAGIAVSGYVRAGSYVPPSMLTGRTDDNYLNTIGYDTWYDMLAAERANTSIDLHFLTRHRLVFAIAAAVVLAASAVMLFISRKKKAS